ncbi:MAG: hypothetical protein H0U75_06700 [Legionella sp.]|nr:hypothetical protein [Legionella sp.]
MNTYEINMLNLIHFNQKTSQNIPYSASIYDDTNQQLVIVSANEKSPINHAEILAINECALQFPSVKWENLTLYTTGEPCCMCAAACCWANLKEVVYATDIPFMIKLWGIESSIRAKDIIKSYPKQPTLLEGICKEQSDQMFMDSKSLFANLWSQKRWVLDDLT